MGPARICYVPLALLRSFCCVVKKKSSIGYNRRLDPGLQDDNRRIQFDKKQFSQSTLLDEHHFSSLGEVACGDAIDVHAAG